jgi:hypothetical protein
MTDWTDVTHRYLPGGDKPPVLDHVLNGQSRQAHRLARLAIERLCSSIYLPLRFFVPAKGPVELHAVLAG